MAHSGSPSLHAILEESTGEDDSSSSEGRSSSFPISRDYNVVTPTITIATMPLPEGPPVPLTESASRSPCGFWRIDDQQLEI
jgi:hypothetical protein